MTANDIDPASDLPANAFAGDIPPIADQSGLPLMWPQEAQAAVESGIATLEHWLGNASTPYLWTLFSHGRARHASALDRAAYEIGFLTRLQQHLKRMPHG